MDPLVFSLGIFEISASYILVVVGFLLSTWLAIRTIHEKNLSLKFLSDHMILYALGALVLGRIGTFVSFYGSIQEKMLFEENFLSKIWVFISSFLSFWQGGFDVFWGLGGFLVLFLFFCSLKNQQPLAWMDAFALPTILFFIFFFLAAFFAGWRYGSPVSENFLFSVTYDLKDVLYSGSIHAVQLYSVVIFSSLLIGGGFLWIRKIRHSWPHGIYGGMMLSLSFFTLSFLELFRGDTGKKIFDIFPFSSLLFFIFALSLLIFMIWRGHFHVFSKFKSIIS